MKILSKKKTNSCAFKTIAMLLVLMVISLNNFAQYYNDVLSYKFNGTPDHGVKINTNIPFVTNQQMPTIILEGYHYHSNTPIDIKLVYYVHNDEFIKNKATSGSGYKPDIYLSNENGKVVIFMDDRSYYTRFHIRAYANLFEKAEWFSGWTHEDKPKATGLPAGHQVLVPYDQVLDSSVWQSSNNKVFYPNPNGKVGIGTNNLSAELTVNGHIHAQEVKVFTEAGADFVFDENYHLPSLNKLEKFISKNKHLPDIPSEKEMIEEGIQLAEMNVRLLQKVEELTLYVIDMDKRLNALKQASPQPQRRK